MSFSAKRSLRAARRRCACGRKALFIRPSSGHLAWRRDHPLCIRCYAALLDRVAAARLPFAARGVAHLEQ
jgi:hypothetical protein